MLYGLYQSAQGAHVQARRLEVTAHNLANVNTTAFKQDVTVVRTVPQFSDLFNEQFLDEFDDRGLQNHNGATAVADVVTDHSNGPISETGGRFDVAFRGPGFFHVTDGTTNYLTRNGSFAPTPDGTLVMADSGLAVLDPNGTPILVPPDAQQISISASGIISDELGPFSSLGVVIPPDTADLQKRGDSLYAEPEKTVEMDPGLINVLQGYLEQSGVEPMSEMLSMIEISRAFEMNMNMIQHQDQSLGRLLSAAAKV